ncbi:MAG: hypothetical protein RL000_48 [Bacteroidota bacterium]|jgi:hypothetical protein
MKKSIFVFLSICALLTKVCGQNPVPVYEEPRHKPVFTNEYVRIIQARIIDKDTSLFHIHATPSAFVFVKTAHYENQVLGENWTTPNYPKGYAWYSSFAGSPSIHRVAAHPNDEIFAYDVELLSNYLGNSSAKWNPLTKDTIFISDKAAGYRIQLSKQNPSFEIKERGPVVAILLSGERLSIASADKKQVQLKETDYAYLSENKKHVLKIDGDNPIEVIIFEVR